MAGLTGMRAARYLPVLAVALPVLLVSLHGITVGLSSHGDSRAMFEHSVPAILSGSYEPGRSYGNPLYEFAAALMVRLGGVVLANAYSLLLALISLLLFDRLLGPEMPPFGRLLALAAFGLNPLFLVNASTFFEWMQLVFLCLCLVSCAEVWTRAPKRIYLFGYALSTVLVLLTRPDAGIVCGCVCGAMLWQTGFRPRRTLALVAATFSAGLAALAIYAALNGSLGFFHTDVLGADTAAHRVARAAVEFGVVFGLFGSVIMAAALAGIVRRLLSGRADQLSFWDRLLLLAVPVVLLRFAALPTKLEFIIVLPMLLVLVVARGGYRTGILALLAFSLASTSLFAVSLFERSGSEDRLHFALGLQPGAVAQDWAVARYEWQVMRPDFLAKIADVVYGGQKDHPRLYSVNYAAGLISDDDDLVIGATETYHFDNSRSDPVYQRRLYRAIYVCDRSMASGNLGWRLMEPPVPRPTLDRDGNIDLHCRREASDAAAK